MRFGEVIAVDRNVGEAIAFCKDLDLRRRSHLTNFFSCRGDRVSHFQSLRQGDRILQIFFTCK